MPLNVSVTTFSKSGYEKYARKMLQSVCENWPTKIIAYVESPIDIEHENLEVRNFFDIEGVMNFYQNIKNVQICHGIIKEGYNYNYDIWKFSRKMFAQWDVLKDHKGKVFWIDSDCFIRKPVPEHFLSSLFMAGGGTGYSEDEIPRGLCFLGRPGVYTETGFVGFDTENDKFEKFLHFYMGFIRFGWFKEHKRWHDCEAFDFAREKSGISGNDLSPFFKIPKDRKMSLDDLDVFGKSVLGEYIVHFKGKRKGVFQKDAADVADRQIQKTA